MVANQATLIEIATYLPLVKKDLLQITGFGKAKVDRYGDEILEAVQEYCSRNNLESNMDAKGGKPKKERKEKSLEEKTPSNIISFDLFKEGKSVAEIAKERNLSLGTIEGHLASFVASGEININDMVSEKKQILIKEAAQLYAKEGFKILKEHLPEDITYGEIRMVLTVAERES
jgi:ATP-dependent DNA helicase RecQ